MSFTARPFIRSCLGALVALSLTACALFEAEVKPPKPRRPSPQAPRVLPSGPKTPEQVRAKAQSIMRRYEAGRFSAKQSAELSDGWSMESRDGRRYYRSFLNNQATAIGPLGPEAIPELVFWLDHEENYMRYLARFSLGLITQLEVEFPIFESRKELRRRGVIRRAQDRYRAWFDER